MTRRSRKHLSAAAPSSGWSGPAARSCLFAGTRDVGPAGACASISAVTTAEQARDGRRGQKDAPRDERPPPGRWKTEGVPPRKQRSPEWERRRRILSWTLMISLLIANVLVVNTLLKGPQTRVTVPYDVFAAQLGGHNV